MIGETKTEVKQESNFSLTTALLVVVVVAFAAIILYRMIHSPEERASKFVANFYGVPVENVRSTCDGTNICISRYADKTSNGTLIVEVYCGVTACKFGL